MPESDITILLVDDEEMVLTSIRSFLAIETDYRVHTFTSPVKALQELDRLNIDLVISDYLMPDMDGITFLGKSKGEISSGPSNPADRICRQGKRHQSHQRRRTLPVHRKALEQR